MNDVPACHDVKSQRICDRWYFCSERGVPEQHTFWYGRRELIDGQAAGKFSGAAGETYRHHNPGLRTAQDGPTTRHFLSDTTSTVQYFVVEINFSCENSNISHSYSIYNL